MSLLDTPEEPQVEFTFPPFVGESKEERLEYLQNEINKWSSIALGLTPMPEGSDERTPTAQDCVTRLTEALYKFNG
jgi:hypothetical protein